MKTDDIVLTRIPQADGVPIRGRSTWLRVLQRVSKQGETRCYRFVRELISVNVALYDAEGFDGGRNCYTPQRPLIAENKLGPPVS